jgi:hypothetical protein
VIAVLIGGMVIWYITKHQNAAVRAAGALPAWDEPAALPVG